METLTLHGSLTAINKDDLSIFGISEAAIISRAKNLIPDELSDDLNIDLMPVTANLAVVNKFNSNGDGIDTDSAIEFIDRLKGRPLNIEHKKDKIVGHIVNATLSDSQPEFEENDTESFKGRKDPFYISISAVIYKHIFPDLSEKIEEASDVENPSYQSISTSWELGFSDFAICKGSELLSECQIIEDPKEALAMKKYLSGLGGKGCDEDGNKINRLIVGTIYPLGAALTMSPAAEVSGVYTEKNKEIEKNQVTYSKISVDNNEAFNNKVMDENQFNKLIETLEKSVASKVSETSKANDLVKAVRDALEEHGTNWQSQVEKEKEAKAALENTVKEMEKSNSELKQELADIKASVEVQEKAEIFNARMNYVDANYELSDKEKEVLASEIKDLEKEDAAFDTYKDRLSVLFAHKSKEFLKEQKEQEDKKIQEAVEAKLQEIKASKGEINLEDSKDLETKDLEVSDSKDNLANTNSSTADEKSLLEQLQEGFEYEIKL